MAKNVVTGVVYSAELRPLSGALALLFLSYIQMDRCNWQLSTQNKTSVLEIDLSPVLLKSAGHTGGIQLSNLSIIFYWSVITASSREKRRGGGGGTEKL